MKLYALAAVLLVIVGALCFIMFIMFNYVLYNPDSGLVTKLDESATEQFNTDQLARWVERNTHLSTYFAIAGIVCSGAAVILFLILAFDRPTPGG